MDRTIRVLTVLASGEMFERYEQLLSQVAGEVNRAGSGQPAIAMAAALRYDLILAQYPLQDLSLGELLEGIRLQDSPSRTSPVLVLTRPDRLAEIEAARGCYGFRPLSLNESESDVRKIFCDVICSSRRYKVSMMAWLAMDSGHIACRIKNLSETGAFLQVDHAVPIGAEILLSFACRDEHSDTSCPILAKAEVVRHADPRNEGVAGVGVRFLFIRDNGRERLRQYLAAMQDPASAPDHAWRHLPDEPPVRASL